MLTPTEELPSGVTISDYSITYVDYSVIIDLYVVSTGIPTVSPVESGTQIKYRLDLIYNFNNNYGFPLSNFVKFGSQDIANIDGGVID